MLEFLRVVADQNITPPSQGADLLFLDEDGVYKTMNSAGVSRVLGRGINRIERTAGDGSEGTDDAYTIFFDGGDTYNYVVHNGSDGRSIVSVVRISGSGLEGTTDIYEITYTKAPFKTTFPVYNGKDGRSIESIERVTGNGAEGTTDIYQISYTKAPLTSFFPVYNGSDGRSIVSITPPANPGQPGAIDTYTINYTKAPLTSTFQVYNGQNGRVNSVNGKTEADIVLTAADVGAIPAADKGAANGVATLDGAGKVPASQLPAFVDDVLEFASLAQFPATGETGKIYVAQDTGFSYRWSGSAYVLIAAQNAFAAVTGNTGTATADQVADTLAITGTNGITTAATDTPDGLTITPTYGTPTGLAPDGANAAGTANTFARADHVHATPTDTAVGLNGASTSTEGTSTSFARADHTHAIANGGTPSSITPGTAANQGASTSLARSDHTHTIATDPPVALGASASEGTSNAFARADHVHINPVIAHEAAADPHPQYATTAEAAAAAPVQSFNGRTGAITPQQADYDQFFTTPAEAAAAAPVQSVNGQTGNVTIATSLQSATATLGANVTLPTTNAQVALVSVSLAAGTWLITAHATFTRTATTAGKFSIMIGPNATVGNAYASSSIDHPSLANVFVNNKVSALVTLAATTTVTLYGAHSAGATSNIVRALNQQNAAGATKINAIKVA